MKMSLFWTSSRQFFTNFLLLRNAGHTHVKMNRASRILSIQSHVVHGYVGNKSAVFPLQLLGMEVDSINSVQFSNHTGYAGGVRGQVLDDQQLWELVEGLRTNGVDRYTHIINGYIGTESFLLKLAEVVKVMKERNPGLTYVCDPVMGDFGPGMYVPDSLLPVYKSVILPLADVCLPNQFEAELLTDRKISTEAEALSAMREIHSLGVEKVILSSAELKKNDVTTLVALASDKSGAAYRIEIPLLPVAFVGTGDLFTALITAWLERTGSNLASTLEHTVATMQTVLRRTLTAAGDETSPARMELKLIQSKRDIEEPKVEIKAQKITE